MVQMLCNTDTMYKHAGGPSAIKQLSANWALLTDEEKKEWKVKASDGLSWMSTPEQKKKAIHELICITEENVSYVSVYCLAVSMFVCFISYS